LKNERLFPILLIIFTNILGAGVIIPILPLYAEGSFQGTVIQITLLSTAYFGAQFLAAPVLGQLSDRYGRRPILIVSQIGTVLAFILFIFAGVIGRRIDALSLALPLSGGMLMLFVARILDGLTGGNITTAQAYISDITKPEDRAQGLGLLQAAFGAGFIFGPALGGVLSNYGPSIPFIGAAVVTTGTLLLTIFTLKESHPPERRQQLAASSKGKGSIAIKAAFSHRTLSLILSIGFIASLAFSALPSIFALFANNVLFAQAAQPERNQLFIGLMLTFNGLMTVVTQVALLRRLINRLGERRLLLLGQFVLVITFLSISQTQNAIVVTMLLAPFAFGQGVSEPSIQSLVTRFGSLGNSGQLLGVYQSARSLALIIGPIWAGFAYETFSPGAVFLGGGLMMGVALLGGLLLQKAEIPERIDPSMVESKPN
jgi:MFS transporter, DHA1 family, tetracycline resistance protein